MALYVDLQAELTIVSTSQTKHSDSVSKGKGKGKARQGQEQGPGMNRTGFFEGKGEER